MAELETRLKWADREARAAKQKAESEMAAEKLRIEKELQISKARLHANEEEESSSVNKQEMRSLPDNEESAADKVANYLSAMDKMPPESSTVQPNLNRSI